MNHPAASQTGGERWAVFARRGEQVVERWFASKTEAEDFTDALENNGFENIAVGLLPRLGPIRDLLANRGVA